MRSCTRVHLSLAGVGAGALLLWLVTHEALAGIIGPTDDRFELSKVPGLKDIGFDREDFAQAMACTGAIVCTVKGPKATMVSTGSAASIFSADRIVTAAHIFYNPKTRQRHPSLGSCYFRNYSNRRPIPIVVTATFEDQLYANDPSKNRERDWAVVRLRSAIPGCKPYDGDPSGDVLWPGTELLVISHLHEDLTKKFSGREPIGQRCTVRNSLPGRLGGLPIYLTDCDAERGGSGSIGLIRRSGKWIPKALMVVTKSGVNYVEFDVSRSHFTGFLAIELDFLHAIGIEQQRRQSPAPTRPVALPPAVDVDDQSRASATPP